MLIARCDSSYSNTDATIKEIARILKEDGTAGISVYSKYFLKFWNVLRPLLVFSLFGARLTGRGRESIFKQSNVDEIVRLYDGAENPIGKSYTREKFVAMLSPYFDVEETYFHFFPARSLPFKIPKFLHRFLDKNFGFMISATFRKRCAE